MSFSPSRQGTETSITVVQGEFRISADPAVALSTVLGSCVAVCLHDPVAQVGGMNHFLLPSRDGAGHGDIRYGANAMELLINGLLKAGAQRGRLRAKAFGGANMASNLRSIGADNEAFARRFLQAEGIPILSESLGGNSARRVRFWPASGKARQLMIPKTELTRQPAPPPVTAPEPVGDITLF